MEDKDQGLLRYRKILQSSDPFELAFGRDSYPWFNKVICGLADKSGYSVEQVAGVVAVLSPMVQWVNCLQTAWAFIKVNGEFKNQAGFKRNYEKAKRILLENDLSLVSGPKVKPFWKTMIDPSCPEPVIDTHMICAYKDVRSYTVDVRKFLKKEVREEIVQAISILSAEYGWPVSRTQGTIWITWKRHTKGFGDQLCLWGNGNGIGNLSDVFRGFPL